MNYEELKKELDHYDILYPDHVKRLKVITDLLEKQKEWDGSTKTDEENENWFKCCQLLRSVVERLTAEVNVLFPRPLSEPVRRSDGLPTYELPDYSLIDEFKEDVLESAVEGLDGQNIALWINGFLRQYFHIPNAEIQIPILSAFMLMNSMAAPANEKYPKLWLHGTSGSGKTRISEMIKYLYGGEDSPRVGYCFGTQSTAAGLRNTLDVVGRQHDVPTLFHWENVTPSDILSKIKEAYTILLTNSRAKANKGNLVATKEGGVIEYQTHTLWTLDSTQQWGAQGKEGEVRRRLLMIKTEKSDKSFVELSNFSWKNLPQKHADLWTKEKTEKSFYPLLIRCKKLCQQKGFYFKASDYEPYYQLIASGVHCGIWENVEAALECCIEHHKLNESAKAEGSPLKVLVQTIVENLIIEYKWWCSQRSQDVWHSPPDNVNAMKIPVNHPTTGLKRKITDLRGSITLAEIEGKVTEIMSDLGYAYIVDDVQKECYFVKDHVE